MLVLMLWAGMISSQVILWWELGWKLQRMSYSLLSICPCALWAIMSISSIVVIAASRETSIPAQQDPGAHAVDWHDRLPGHPLVGAWLEAPAGALNFVQWLGISMT